MDERVYELAQRREQERRADGIAAVLGRPADPPLVIDGVRVCRDCAQVIPWARLRLGTRIVRCVECQEVHERRNRGGNR